MADEPRSDTASAGPKPAGLEPGVYPFTRLVGDSPTRFHLRVDPDGGGLLLANSAEAAHLTPTGVVMVHGLLLGLTDGQITARVQDRFYGVWPWQIADDLAKVRRLLDDLATPEDNYPITNFGGAGAPDTQRRLSAPFQAHVVQGEPDTIRKIVLALWDVGVPQVTYLAQPDRAPQDLVRLVEIAEDIGLVAGIRTAASWLPEHTLRLAAMAGLDYLCLLFTSCDPAEHDEQLGAGDHEALMRLVETCHDLELCPVAQVPLTDRSADELEAIIQCMAERGVRNLAFFALACLDGDEEQDAAGALPARALPQVATEITEYAEETDSRFLWDPPVRFDLARSLAEQVIAGPRASGEVSIRIEADGTVYAPRGPRIPCGNILHDAWTDIWSHEAFTRYREVVEAPSRCDTCPDLALCAAACPKDPSGWADDTVQGEAS